MGMVPSRASDEVTAEYRQRFLLGLLPANGGGTIRGLNCPIYAPPRDGTVKMGQFRSHAPEA